MMLFRCKAIMVFIGVFIFINYNLHAQDKILFKDTIIPEVNSLVEKLKEDSCNNPILLYYSDGAAKTGLILWKTSKKNYGIAFIKIANDKIETTNIKQKILKKYLPLDKYIDSVRFLKKEDLKNNYKTSHDFNLMWIYFDKGLVDTTVRKMSNIIYKTNHFASSLFLQYDKIYTLTIPHSVKWRGGTDR